MALFIHWVVHSFFQQQIVASCLSLDLPESRAWDKRCIWEVIPGRSERPGDWKRTERKIAAQGCIKKLASTVGCCGPAPCTSWETFWSGSQNCPHGTKVAPQALTLWPLAYVFLWVKWVFLGFHTRGQRSAGAGRERYKEWAQWGADQLYLCHVGECSQRTGSWGSGWNRRRAWVVLHTHRHWTRHWTGTTTVSKRRHGPLLLEHTEVDGC